MKEMELVGLRQHENIGIPIMLLKEPDGEERILPIFIGKSEALAIALAMEGVTSPRPMTHDLMAEVIRHLWDGAPAGGDSGSGRQNFLRRDGVRQAWRRGERFFASPAALRTLSLWRFAWTLRFSR